MATIRKVLVNPYKRRKPAKKKNSPARRKNPGTLTVLGLTNPERKRTMKKKTTPKKRAVKRASNPVSVRKVAKKTTRRRRNPNVLSKGANFAKQGMAALTGLVLTRQIPQMLLKDSNTGVMGYAANVAVAFAAAALGSKFAGQEIGRAMGIGGAVYVANRILSEKVSPIGKVLSLSGLGDAMAADHSQLSGVHPATFYSPETFDTNGQPAIPDAIERRIAAIGAPPSAKMAGLRFAA